MTQPAPVPTQLPTKERLSNDEVLIMVFGVIAVVLAAYLIIRSLAG
jgi:hypothetical protein